MEFFTGTGSRLEQTVLPTPNSVDLMRTVESEYIHRFHSKTPHVAELFHENSKCTRSMPMIVENAQQQRAEIHQWYLSTSYNLAEEDRRPEVCANPTMMPGDVQSLLAVYKDDKSEARLSYALDVFLLVQHVVYRCVPGQDLLWIERKLRNQDTDALHAALFEFQALEEEPLLFIVAAPWRYMMLYGPRGYRHTLMDAGRLLQVWSKAADIEVSCNYFDHCVDEVLQLDGVERSVLAAVRFKKEKDDNSGKDS